MAKWRDRKAYNARGRNKQDQINAAIDRKRDGVPGTDKLRNAARFSASEERVRELFLIKNKGRR